MKLLLCPRCNDFNAADNQWQTARRKFIDNLQLLSDCDPLKLLDNAPVQNAGGPCGVEAGQLFLSLDSYIEDPFAQTDLTELGEAETDAIPRHRRDVWNCTGRQVNVHLAHVEDARAGDPWQGTIDENFMATVGVSAFYIKFLSADLGAGCMR